MTRTDLRGAGVVLVWLGLCGLGECWERATIRVSVSLPTHNVVACVTSSAVVHLGEKLRGVFEDSLTDLPCFPRQLLHFRTSRTKQRVTAEAAVDEAQVVAEEADEQSRPEWDAQELQHHERSNGNGHIKQNFFRVLGGRFSSAGRGRSWGRGATGARLEPPF